MDQLSPQDAQFLYLETPDNLGRVRAKLLNLDTMFSKWDNNVFSDGEFLKL